MHYTNNNSQGCGKRYYPGEAEEYHENLTIADLWAEI
jgi:hypothetical protein